VAPDAENIREVLTNGGDALLFDPAVNGALEAALLRLCLDPSLRARLGEAARQTIVERSFTWARNAERVLAIAEAAVLQAPGRRPTAKPASQGSPSVES
jgi:glycosyltransferase involved in cell wall biosynthesis